MRAVTGTPPPALFPAKNYVMQTPDENRGHVLKVPRVGSYHELDPEFFDEDAGVFQVVSEDGAIVDMTTLTRVLFATRQYPSLEFDQFFVINNIAIRGDEVWIIGQQVRVLAPVAEEDEAEEGGD